jgi:radical SAM protein with 4Fe4S-binding SPASM domain
MLDNGLFERVLEQTAGHLMFLTLYFQGEPYLHPEFIRLVQMAKRKRLHVTTSTNGHYLDDATAKATVESGLDKLIVSVDGATQESYAQYRVGGSLDKVLEGIKRLVEWKRKLNSAHPQVVFQVLIVRPNEHELDRLAAIAREIGVDRVLFKTAQVYAPSDDHALIPSQEQHARYVRQPDGTWKIKNPLRNSCWKMWHSCVMTWDGKIVPCCFDKDARHQVGDLNGESFRSVWFSPPYQDFRKKLFKGRSEIDICTNCSEGTKVFG